MLKIKSKKKQNKIKIKVTLNHKERKGVQSYTFQVEVKREKIKSRLLKVNRHNNDDHE